MNLEKRKQLAAKVLGVGKNKIRFDSTKLAEIKEAITKQDIRDFYAEGIITIKDKGGRLVKERRKNRRGAGKVKMKVWNGKRNYIILVRKFRRYVKELKNQGKLNKEQYLGLRKRIKAKEFKDKAHLKEHTDKAGEKTA